MNYDRFIKLCVRYEKKKVTTTEYLKKKYLYYLRALVSLMQTRRLFIGTIAASASLNADQSRNTYSFASADKARQVLSRAPVIEEYSLADLEFRLGHDVTAKGRARKEVRELVRANVLEWDYNTRERVQPVIESVLRYFDVNNVRLPTVNFALVDTKEYGAPVGYTVGNMVAFPEGWLVKDWVTNHGLAHEVAHVFTRHASDDHVDQLYEVLGFHRGNIELPKELKEDLLVNPDEPEKEYYLLVGDAKILPVARFKDGALALSFLELGGDPLRPVSTDVPLVNVRDTPEDVRRAAGGNTGYVLGAPEVLADNLALAYRRWSGVGPAKVDHGTLDRLEQTFYQSMR